MYIEYLLVKNFPRDERYETTSQLKRTALSVVLNYIEGYVRNRSKSNKNFLEISYASLKKSKYLLLFCFDEGFVIDTILYERLVEQADRIGAIL